MKKKIADHIEKLLMKGKPLTDAQVKAIVYWELVDFQCDTNDSDRFPEGYDEVFTLV